MIEKEKFKSYLELNQGYSQHTVVNYLSDLNQIEKFFIDNNLNDLNQLNNEHIQAYIKVNSKLSSASLNRKLSCLRSYLKFAFFTKLLQQDLSNVVPKPKRITPLPFVLNETDTLKLVSIQDDNLRDKALFEILYSCGLRISEASNLDWSDVLWNNKQLRVRHGKGGKERIIPLLSSVISTLKQLKGDAKDSMPVFCNKFGERLGTRSMFKIVTDRAKRLGLPKTVTPHTLRHSFATHLLSNGANLRTIQTLLGHASITTTEIYTQLDQKKIKEEHENSHPLAKLR